ncbi:MAG: MBL fold metallo-hydrolase [Maritimibacter sp.]
MTILRPTRRDMLNLAALMPTFAMPGAAFAKLGGPQGDQPGYFRFSVGDARVTILSDGWFPQPLSALGMNADEAEKLAFLDAHFLPTDEIIGNTNHVIVEQGAAKVLIDVGSGARFFDSAGRLMTNLVAAGIDPASITHVVITHAHPDHIWGIRDDFDEAIIPGAQYVMGEVEHGYWLSEGLVDQVAPEAQQFVVGAINSIRAEGVEWHLMADGAEVVPGVSLMATHGHTPGHMSVRISSGADQLIVLGDAITHAFGHFAHPEWYGAMDSDKDQTVATRKALLDMAAADRIPVVGYHFPFPGVGHVAREGEAYRFVPALWRF